jgi:hypothetical protein
MITSIFPQDKTSNKFTRIAAGEGVSALTAVMLILAFLPPRLIILCVLEEVNSSDYYQVQLLG